jgi:hypothetical protein
MLEHKTSEVYKSFAGSLCLSENSLLLLKGAFNQVNILKDKDKDEYVVSFEHGLIDINLLNKLIGTTLTIGKIITIVNNSLNLSLVYKYSEGIIVPDIISNLVQSKEVKEWSMINIIPKMLIVGDLMAPHIRKIPLMSLRTKDININSDISKTIEEDNINYVINNRQYQIPSIYGPLV